MNNSKLNLNTLVYSVTTLVYEMYQHQFVCTSRKYRTWYEFRNHHWCEDEGGSTLRRKLSDEVLNQYLIMNQKYLTYMLEIDKPNIQPYIDHVGQILEIMSKLQDITFKEKVMKECEIMFYDRDFMNRLDANPNLICFENGVYDLDINEFRNGRPEDYCSLSTRYDYMPYDELDQKNIEDVEQFMSRIFPVKKIREYVWTLLASFLVGDKPDKKTCLWIGAHSNGKSSLMELLTRAFGEYIGTLPIWFFSAHKKASSMMTSPKLARMRGKRLVYASQPNQGERLNIDLMMDFSGNDRIVGCPMFKPPFEFNPQFKMVLICNDLSPKKISLEPESLNVIHFTSRFTSNPQKENEFQIDAHLPDKFDAWKETFMWLLLNNL